MEMMFNIRSYVGKIILMVFCDMNSPLLILFQETIVTSATYCDQLHRFQKEIHRLHSGFLSQGVFLSHDIARSHTACRTVYTITKLRGRSSCTHHSVQTSPI